MEKDKTWFELLCNRDPKSLSEEELVKWHKAREEFSLKMKKLENDALNKALLNVLARYPVNMCFWIIKKLSKICEPNKDTYLLINKEPDGYRRDELLTILNNWRVGDALTEIVTLPAYRLPEIINEEAEVK